MPFQKFNNRNIHYTDAGHGKAIVLIHGFLESLLIWKNFTKALSEDYRVVTIDLPGHGKSEVIGEIQTMELMAEMVHSILKSIDIHSCVMIGHSMGGFVTLAFAEKYPGMLRGFGLFHSHAFEDTEEGKTNRIRSIGVVKKDKFSYLSMFLPALFSSEARVKYKKEIEQMITEANKMTKEGIISCLEGMKIRPRRLHVLSKTKVPVLFIIGLQDIRFPVDQAWEMIRLPKQSRVLILREVAHMGYIEAPDETLTAVSQFVESL